jgi:hypothetical protein
VISIVEFSPARGLVGESIKIFGTGFSPIPSQNRVAFARGASRTGVQAAVISATAAAIVTRVPPGATSGPITVATPEGAATSTAAFTVVPAAMAAGTHQGPVVASLVPTVASAGTEVTVLGAHFDPVARANQVTINGGTRATVRSGTTTAIVLTVPSGATSGRVKVVTAVGAASSARDLVIPPFPHTAADVSCAIRIFVDGQPTEVAVTRPEAFALSPCALVLFDAIARRRLRLVLRNVTIAESDVSVWGPDTTALAPATRITRGDRAVVIELPPLPASVTYTVLVAPRGREFGRLTLAVADRP